MLVRGHLPFKPEKAIILGCGKFGSSAVQKVNTRWPEAEIQIVDAFAEVNENLPGEHYSRTDAIQFLLERLETNRPDDLIIPCIPIHVAYNWVLNHLGFCIPVPVRLMGFLPGAVAGKDGCIFTSLSDFVCPLSCAEPPGKCMVTGVSREKPLFDVINSINLNSYKTIVLRSEQLLPGVGAITAGQLSELLDRVRGSKGRFLIATASRCHGVVHGFVH